MSSGRGRIRHPFAAFTVIELLLSLALLVLVATAFVGGAANFLHWRDDRPDLKFWQAVTAARQQALSAGQIVQLRYQPKARALVWSWPGDHDQLALTVQTLQFLPAQRGAVKLLGGVLEETTDLPLVRFYPDGTCDAFRATLTETDGRKVLLQIDPWTCAAMPAPAS